MEHPRIYRLIISGDDFNNKIMNLDDFSGYDAELNSISVGFTDMLNCYYKLLDLGVIDEECADKVFKHNRMSWGYDIDEFQEGLWYSLLDWLEDKNKHYVIRIYEWDGERYHGFDAYTKDDVESKDIDWIKLKNKKENRK